MKVQALALMIFVSAAAFDTAALDVIQDERVLVDSTRSTPPNGSFPGASNRTLRTLLWVPVPPTPCGAADLCPPYLLLLMAHGFTGLPERFDAFATAVALEGFVVAAPAFPLTNQFPPGGTVDAGDLVNQPDDVAFVVNALRNAAIAGDPVIGDRDPDRLAVLGHSLGAATVDALVHTDCCTHVPVDAAILVATPNGLSVTLGDRISTGPPTLILHGTEDFLIPFETSFDLFALLPVPRFLGGITGGGHNGLVESQIEPPIEERTIAQRATVAWLNRELRDDASGLASTLAELGSEGHMVRVGEVPAAETIMPRPAQLKERVGAFPLRGDSVLIAGAESLNAARKLADALAPATGFDPLGEDPSPEQQAHVLGAQGQIWSEFILDGADAERFAFPRLTALAEVVWTPPERKDFADFERRLDTHLQRLRALGVQFLRR